MTIYLSKGSGACEDCGLPGGNAVATAPCPFCGHLPVHRSAEQLRTVLTGLGLAELQRLQLALRTDDVTGDPIDTTVDVLLALFAVSEETATPDQLDQVIENVVGDRLDQLPLPRFATCFCASGLRYGKCHGRPRVEQPTATTTHVEDTEPQRRTA